MSASSLRQLLVALIMIALAGGVALTVFGFEQIKSQAAVFNHAADLAAGKTNPSSPANRAKMIVSNFKYSGDQTRLQNDLNELARSARVDQPQISVAGNQVTIKFDKDQDYKNLIQFIHALETTPHDIAIASISLASSSSSGRVSVKTFTLSIDGSGL